ncbi:unnamed protein product [Pseudo-nitzschia multistriata]|uniref:fructokinase n=1 Tax=Pseudo-nitzschia multistriata TaxID=183589 RepID=A0A448Z4U2_9STRA|nr:unnamed protein product [Pseudo-nitzschia multistriata]
MPNPVLVAAVEGGGTSFVVAVAEINMQSNNTQILHRAEIDSSHDDPNRTLEECASFFRNHKNISEDGYRALGVAMFGPLGCNAERKEHYGRILPTTPKKSWRGVDILTPLVKACESEGERGRKIAVKIDTDVNAPAVAEYLAIKADPTATSNPISSLAYVTIGTGVGVGLVIHGQPIHGKMHPEGGHVPVQPLEGDNFTGYSWGANSKNPFRGKHTVESMTSSVALAERLEQLQGEEGNSSTNQQNLNRSCLADLKDDDHEVWSHAANALANLCVTLALVTSVEKIVLGGGVMNRNGLIEKVRQQTRFLLNGYLGDLTDADLSEWITSSSYGSDVGLMGALVLAQQAIAEEAEREKATVVPIKKLKQIAYGAGLWHGFGLGLSAAYIGICLWARSGKSSSRR